MVHHPEGRLSQTAAERTAETGRSRTAKSAAVSQMAVCSLRIWAHAGYDGFVQGPIASRKARSDGRIESVIVWRRRRKPWTQEAKTLRLQASGNRRASHNEWPRGH